VESCALIDRTDRELVAVSGADAASFLHRLLANSVRALEPGQGNRNLLLSSKGKVLFDVDLAVEAERITLSVAGGAGAALARALDTYHFSEKLKIADASSEHAPLALIGPRAAELVAQLTGVTEQLADHAWTRGAIDGAPARVTAMPIAGSQGFVVDAGPALAAKSWDALRAASAVPLGRVAYDSLRVEAGWAEPGVDVDENVYPQEARLERAFSLDKGCYIGQEVVAKIDTYGGLNKRLVALALSHDDPLPRGARLLREDGGEWRDLGVVTSWAYSFALDRGLALAYVKRRHQAVGTHFRVGDANAPIAEATIVALPVRASAVAPTGEFE
jgi:folate-binding protein YgfZ